MEFSFTDEQNFLIEELIKSSPRSIFLLGGVDTGKTVFSLGLAFQALKKGLKVGIVDADVGQSNFGPPTTIGFVYLSRPVANLGDLLDTKPASLYFVGDISPRGHLLEMVVGVKAMFEKAQSKNCDLIIVDTTGMISYPFGYALKYHKINLLSPQDIVAFQRGKEAEAILESISTFVSFKIHHLSVPKMVRRNSFHQRTKFREEKYRTYFRGSHYIRFKAKELSFYPPQINLRDPNQKDDLSRVVVGLKNSPKEALGIGIFAGFNGKNQLIEILTPVDERKVTGLVFGSIKINSRGEELGRVFLRKLQ